MSKLEDLINKLCPEGVEHKTLNEVTKWDKRFNNINNNFYKSFNHVSAAKLKDLKNDKGTVKLLSTGNFDGVALKEDAMEYLNNDEIFTIPSGGAANIKYFKGEFVDSGNIIGTSLNSDLYNTKYIYYFLENNNEIIQSFFRGSGVKHPDMSAILNIKIAVPPLEVQCEIVRILDDFTLLSAELSAELNARKKQYDYYKDELYSFKNKNVKYVKLKDIAEIIRGGNFQKKDFVENGKPCIHYGQIYTRYGSSASSTFTYVTDEVFNKSKQAQPNDIIMAVTSENVEDVCKCVVWCGNENVAVSGHTAIIHHNINAKYLGYYFSTSHFYKDKTKLVHGTKVMEVTPSTLNEILIPLPDLKEQERIATLIEKFDKLCNDITSGIPAEIEKRQKQYEYYRNLLLNFKEVQYE